MAIRFLLFLSIFPSFLRSQNIRILNSETQSPIENIIIFDKYGNYIGKTNSLGEINKELLIKNPNFILNNPTIKTDTLAFDKIYPDKILIKQITKKTDIEKPAVKSYKEYIVLTGYFNIYTTKNSRFHTYIDGIIQYIFDNKTNEYIKQNIKQYRFIRFDSQNYQNQDSPFFKFEGIMKIPSLENLMKINNSNKNLEKNYRQVNNELLAELSRNINFEKDRKVLGYYFNNLKSDEIYKFSGENINPYSLLDFNRTLSLRAKYKNENNYTTYTLISNFYPSTITYANKNELEKGVKINNYKSNYYTNYWENSCLINLYNQISPKPTFRSYQLRNQK